MIESLGIHILAIHLAVMDGYIIDPLIADKEVNNHYPGNLQHATIKIGDHPKLGKILTDDKGMTLYMYTPDINYTSKCTEECAATWPPYVITGAAINAPEVHGMIGTSKRDDEKSQVVYNGMPLYYFKGDEKPGDAKGQGLGNDWFVVNPDSGPNRTLIK